MKMKIGISSCLLGMPVRYDGGHKYDGFLVKTLGKYVTYVHVCPEVECGLTVPREAMRLVGDSARPEAARLVGIDSGTDFTERMERWAEKRLDELAGEDLCGFIFKSKSPSSGMERVKVYPSAGRNSGAPRKTGVGIFARMFMQRYPLIPVEEDGRLEDPGLRENFVEQIFVLKRFRDSLRRGKRVRELIGFHTSHKLLIMAHSVRHYREMGRLVAGAAEHEAEDVYRQYEQMLLDALRLLPTARKHSNVLQHMAGYFKNDLSADERQELAAIVDQYRTGTHPLIVPITLINHYVRKYGKSYLASQVYLNPSPVELKLRTHL